MVYDIIIFTLIPLSIATAIFLKKYGALKKLVLPALSNSLLRDIFTVDLADSSLMQATMKIIQVLANKFYVDYCTIFLYDNRGLSVIASSIMNNGHLAAIEKYANDLCRELDARGSRSKIKSIAKGMAKLDYPTAEQRNIKYMNFMLLDIGNETIGALLIENRSKNKIEAFEKEFFDIILKSIAIVLRTLIYQDKLAKQAMTDGLTGLSNRACMEKTIKEQIQLHRSTNSPMAVCLLDIDHFKKVNDTYGHTTGDRALKAVSKYIKENVRERDFCFRYGGEEMLIIFSRTSNKDIMDRVEALRSGISQLNIKTDQGSDIHITASFGLSEYPANGHLPEEIIKAADTALYHAKKTGRNRSVMYNSMQQGNN